jgi:hypothetical protein
MGMPDSAVPVGILAIAATRGVLIFGGQFLFGFQPELHTIPGRLAGSLPFVEGAKLNVYAQFHCVYEGVVSGSDRRTKQSNRVASTTVCEWFVIVLTGIHDIAPLVHTAGTGTVATIAIGLLLIDEAFAKFKFGNGSKLRWSLKTNLKSLSKWSV